MPTSIAAGIAPNLHARVSQRLLVASMLFAQASLLAVYNLSILYTPSSLLQLSAGLMMALALERDWIRRMILYGLALAVVQMWMLGGIGDISRVFGWTANFFAAREAAMPAAKAVHFSSVTFTVSLAGLAALALHLGGWAIRLLRIESDPAAPLGLVGT